MSQQLRFGALFLAEGNHSEGAGRSPHPLVCVRGNDTMIVYISPLNSWVNSLYDSIPFRPGRYSLVQLREDKIITTPYRLQEKSFSTYYAQHVAELQRANPFAGCQFAPHTLDPGRDPTAYFPPTPADLFRLLLVYNRYLSIRPWKLRPITALEQRALDRASFAH
ncbi:MAG: hypothetical protein EOO63_07565 [Hymenobacter sp.]|nr:MAG: hypothetical protein EOO63_07565 [Hymenobacter sp.]